MGGQLRKGGLTDRPQPPSRPAMQDALEAVICMRAYK